VGKLADFLKPLERQLSLDLSPEHTASLPIRPLQATEEGEVLAVAPMSGLCPNPENHDMLNQPRAAQVLATPPVGWNTAQKTRRQRGERTVHWEHRRRT
jgi:hypothetical protein